MGITLKGPGIYTPEQKLTNEDLEKIVDTSDAWIQKMTGIKERRIETNLSVPEMAIQAARNLQEKLGSLPKVDEVILATNSHAEQGEFPAYAAAVGAAVGSKDAAFCDLLSGCNGLVYAIRNAHNAIATGEINKAIVVGVEKLSAITDYTDRNTCVLFGDGAGAYLLERGGIEGIITNYVHGSADTERKLATRKKLGGKLNGTTGDWAVTPNVEDKYLEMEGKAIMKFAPRAMGEAIHKVLERAGYGIKDLDIIIPHGANKRIIEAAKKGIEEKGFEGAIFTNLKRYGNTSTASIPLATAEAKEKEIIKEGNLVLNVSFGAGLTYGANLYRA